MLRLTTAIFFGLLMSRTAQCQTAEAPAFEFPAPVIAEENFDQWMAFVEPTEEELAWRDLRWYSKLSVAVAEAERQGKPILLWTMNGHPCGET